LQQLNEKGFPDYPIEKEGKNYDLNVFRRNIRHELSDIEVFIVAGFIPLQ